MVMVHVAVPHTMLNFPLWVEVARMIAGPVAVPPPAVRVEVPGALVRKPLSFTNWEMDVVEKPMAPVGDIVI